MALKGYLIEKYNVMSNAYSCNRLVAEAAARDVDLRIIGVHDTMITSDSVLNHGIKLAPVDFVINRYKWGHEKDALNALAARSYNTYRTHDTDKSLNQLNHRIVEHFTDNIDIVCKTAHDISGRIGVKIAYRQSLNMIKQVFTKRL